MVTGLNQSRTAVFCSFVRHRSGSLQFASAPPGLLDLFGVDPSELERDGSELAALIHSEDVAAVNDSLAAAASELDHWHCEFRIVHRTKGLRWIESHFFPKLEADGSVLWTGLYLDDTERKRAEADQDFLLALGMELQSATETGSIVRVATRMLGTYLQASRCTLSTINVPLNEVVLVSEYPESTPAPVSAGPHPLHVWADPVFINAVASGLSIAIADTASHPITAAYYASAFEPAQIRSLIVIPLRRAGEWLAAISLIGSEPRAWASSEVQLARAAAERIWAAYDAARALAAERQLHDALAASEERLRLAVQSADLGIWESDPQTGERIWDSRSREIFGFPQDIEITAAMILECVHPEDRDMVAETVRAYTDAAGDGRFQMEHRILTWREGEMRFVYGQGQTMFVTEAGVRKAVRSVGTLQDITPLKQGEQSLRRINQELEQFAYAAAHDLQEPLRCTALATQMLTDQYRTRLDNDADSLLKTALDGTLRMQAMVRGLLSFSRSLDSAEGVTQLVNPNQVLSLALKNLQVSIGEKSAEITWDELPALRMRESHLLQIFQNLIGNAIKYCGDKQPKIHVSATSRRGLRLLSVKDNGIGIAPEYHERVFGIFKRLHRDEIPGTGMGLALCKRIVEYYGGKIWLESNEYGGTTVLFSAPFQDERPPQNEPFTPKPKEQPLPTAPALSK
jgi:PAS domain S-box-containing protein